MKWKIDAAVQSSPIQRDFEQSEKRRYPLWKYSENYPWNMANRLSSFPFSDIFWTVCYSDKKRVKSKLSLFDQNENIIFKGDRVQVLVGPDKGKVLLFKIRENLITTYRMELLYHLSKCEISLLLKVSMLYILNLIRYHK